MFERNSLEPEAVKAQTTDLRKTLKQTSIPDDPANIKDRYYVQQRGEQRKYYTDHQQKDLAVTADPNRIKSHKQDRETVDAMLTLAKARGWDTVKAHGTKDFMREAWIQGHVRGVEVKGYKATDTDKQEVAKRLAETGQQAPQAKAAAKAVPINKPPEQANVFAKAEANGNAARAAEKPAQAVNQSAGMAA